MKNALSSADARRLATVTTATLLLLLAAATTSHAQDAAKAIKYRQSAHFLLGWNIGPIGAMVKGERPFDAEEARMRALRLEQVAPMIAEGYPPGSQAGAPTKARPEIWENMDDFRQKVADMEAATQKLVAATATGDVKQVGTALGAVGGTCKACHDQYKAD